MTLSLINLGIVLIVSGRVELLPFYPLRSYSCAPPTPPPPPFHLPHRAFTARYRSHPVPESHGLRVTVTYIAAETPGAQNGSRALAFLSRCCQSQTHTLKRLQMLHGKQKLKDYKQDVLNLTCVNYFTEKRLANTHLVQHKKCKFNTFL